MKPWLIIVILLAAPIVPARAIDGTLSDNQRITSTHLGYDLQYRVYTPPGADTLTDLPVLFVTDGQWYIRSGRMPKIVDREVRRGKIKPVVFVFVDSSNPDHSRKNRRNSEFMCNVAYAKFFVGELVPRISSEYAVSQSREDRVILGLSFGGLNAACFGLLASETFAGIAMQSPAIWPVPIIGDLYASEPVQPIKIFFSIGNQRDGIAEGRAFRNILKKKGYDLHYREVRGGHNWGNWKPLLDDILVHFFPAQPAE